MVRTMERHVRGRRLLSLIALMFVSTMLLACLTASAENTVMVKNDPDPDENYTRDIGKGESAVFNWYVDNFGNSTFQITVRASGPDGWTTEMRPNETTLGPGGLKEIQLTVATDKGEDETAVITVIIEVQEMGNLTAQPVEISKTVIVKLVIEKREKIDFLFWKVSVYPSSFKDNSIYRFFFSLALWTGFCCLIVIIVLPSVKLAVLHTNTEIDDIVLGIIWKPLVVISILTGVNQSLRELEIGGAVEDDFERVYWILLILIVGWTVYKVFKEVLIQFGKEYAAKTETDLDDILIPIVEKLVSVVIFIFVFFSLLNFLGVDLTVFMTGSLVFGLVIAFAAQETLGNFFASIFLLIDRPFTVGDIVLFDGEYCEVKSIGMRSTRFYRIFHNEMMIMPNDAVANATLINLTAPDRMYIIKVEIGASYSEDPEFVEKVLQDIADRSPNILKDKDHKPLAKITNFGASSIDYAVIIWVDDLKNQWVTKRWIQKEIYKRFKEEGIDIPFPQTVVHQAPKEQEDQERLKKQKAYIEKKMKEEAETKAREEEEERKMKEEKVRKEAEERKRRLEETRDQLDVGSKVKRHVEKVTGKTKRKEAEEEEEHYGEKYGRGGEGGDG